MVTDYKKSSPRYIRKKTTDLIVKRIDVVENLNRTKGTPLSYLQSMLKESRGESS